MRVLNETKTTTIAESARKASTFLQRGKGLMFERELEGGSGLIIDPCSSVHMFGMRFPIDVLYVNNDGTVMRAQENLKPWRVGPLYTRGANYVIELPVGVVQSSGTTVGDRVRIVDR